VLLVAYSARTHFQIKKIHQRFIEQDESHKTALSEAGNAITDTLKVAFEQLKKNSVENNRTNNKITELNSKVHRLEHLQANNTRTAAKQMNIEKKQNKNLKDENE
jgi:cell shape-determining protein MreC